MAFLLYPKPWDLLYIHGKFFLKKTNKIQYLNWNLPLSSRLRSFEGQSRWHMAETRTCLRTTGWDWPAPPSQHKQDSTFMSPYPIHSKLYSERLLRITLWIINYRYRKYRYFWVRNKTAVREQILWLVSLGNKKIRDISFFQIIARNYRSRLRNPFCLQDPCTMLFTRYGTYLHWVPDSVGNVVDLDSLRYR